MRVIGRRHRVMLLLNLTGLIALILALAMIPSLVLAHLDGAPDVAGLTWAILISAGLGALLFLPTIGRARRCDVGHREGFLVVGAGWLVAGLVGALPLYLYPHLAPTDICDAAAASLSRPPVGADFCSFTNAAFESISGFTTTGSSILTDGLWDGPGLTTSGGRPGLPRGVLLWRAMTHYLGGMGIIVLGVAILPLLGIGGMELYRAEVPGPTKDKLVPRVGETAKLLWKVYGLISLLEFILLTLGGVDAFNATCHTMATMATGGFSNYSASVAAFGSAYVEWVITLFMWVAGMNFTLHFLALRGQPGAYLRDPEWRAYTAIFLAFTLGCALSLYYGSAGSAEALSLEASVRYAAFQVASIATTTGFASHDFETWTYAPLALFLLASLALIGGMAGSTGGGVKVVRQLLLVKAWLRELFLLVHPRAVRPIRLGGEVVAPQVIRAVSAFLAAYIALLALGALVFTLEGKDLITATSAAASALGNIGPGLGDIGPYDNWAGFTDLGKWSAEALMLLGRLEIYTLLVLLTPAFWRR